MSGFSQVSYPALNDNHPWRLPFDVIFGVMTISLPITISTLMKTCRTLYMEGPRHLLRDGVQLDSTREISKFTTFMLSGDPSRFAYLRKLVLLGIPRVTGADIKDRLLQLLSHPSLALKTLVLRPANYFLGRIADPAVRQAVSGLTSVKHLVAIEVDEYTASSIKRLPWQLESTSIGMVHGVPDPLPTVVPFSGTLRTLLIKEESLGLDSGRCHFPHVQTFGIVYHKFIPAFLANPAFAVAFPAITHLQLIPADAPTKGGWDDPQTWHAIGRAGSSVRSRRERLSWPSLAECSGDLRTVYALHLDCTLETLRLWSHIWADELDLLRAVLQDTHPRRLCLRAEYTQAKPLFAALHTTADLERIDLRITFREIASITELCSLSKALLGRVPMGLVELNLLFHTGRAHPFWRAEASTVKSDTLGAVARLASIAAPSLRFTCRLYADRDDGDWLWPDLGQRVRRDRLGPRRGVDAGVESSRGEFPFGDGEAYFIQQMGIYNNF